MTSLSHHTRFIWPWGLNPELCTFGASTLPTELCIFRVSLGASGTTLRWLRMNWSKKPDTVAQNRVVSTGLTAPHNSLRRTGFFRLLFPGLTRGFSSVSPKELLPSPGQFLFSASKLSIAILLNSDVGAETSRNDVRCADRN